VGEEVRSRDLRQLDEALLKPAREAVSAQGLELARNLAPEEDYVEGSGEYLEQAFRHSQEQDDREAYRESPDVPGDSGSPKLRRFLTLSSIAVSQVTLFLALTLEPGFYLPLTALAFIAVALPGTRESFYHAILAAAILCLTALSVHGRIDRDGERWLNANQNEQLTGQVQQVLRGSDSELKWSIVRFGEHSCLIRFPDLPWPPYSAVAPGAEIQGRFHFELFTVSPLPWSYESHMQRQGVFAKGEPIQFSILREGRITPVESLIALTTEQLGSSNGLDLLLASLLGRGELLSKDLEELFRETATTHLVVVSGFHVGVLARIVEQALLFLLRLYPTAFLLAPASRLTSLGGVAAVLIYGNSIGFSLTVSRAVFALLLIALGKFLFRNSDAALLVIWAFLFVQIIWPGSVFEPGCQLTFAALAGLVFAAVIQRAGKVLFCGEGTLEAALGGSAYRRRELIFKSVIGPLLTCAVVSLTTTPITLLWFSKFIPLGPLINVACIPLFTFLVLLFGGVALLVNSIFGGSLLLRGAISGSELFIWLLEGVERQLHGGIFRPVEVTHSTATLLFIAHLTLLILLVRFSTRILSHLRPYTS